MEVVQNVHLFFIVGRFVKNEVVKIFGKNLFSDGRLLSLFRELTGLQLSHLRRGTQRVSVCVVSCYERGEYNDDEIVNSYRMN